MHPNIHCSLAIYNSQDTEVSKMSLDRWIKKIWYIYAMIHQPKKKEWNNAIFSNKDLEMITVIQENQ